MDNLLLNANHINKSFSGVPVLKNAQIQVRKGEVHALMGENGAGKSTLIKIITGAYHKDSGSIQWKNSDVSIKDYTDCQKLGIACIYQELSVIPALTVAQNIFLGREPKHKYTKLINFRKMNEAAQKLIDTYEFPLKPTDLVSNLGIGLRQLVEILKGLSIDAELLIMDEPTASLSSKEAAMLFSIIESLKKKQVSIIYISHRLEEVYYLADRLTVLRNGENVALLEKSEIIPQEVIHTMIGKVVDESDGSIKKLSHQNTHRILEVQALTKAGAFSDISFSLHKGEILGIGGLIGAGRTELIRCLYGLDPYDSGFVYFQDQLYSPKSIRQNIRNGFGFVPEDRRLEGFVPLLSINRNNALVNYDTIKKRGFTVSDKSELALGQTAIEAMDIRPADPAKPVGLLSGGNQQKVVLGKWLMRDLKILIIDEPTSGIDVGAKNEIYTILKDLAKQGVAVMVVSSDLQELLRISDRILVLRKGKLVQEFSNRTVTQSDILAAASGLDKEVPHAQK